MYYVILYLYFVTDLLTVHCLCRWLPLMQEAKLSQAFIFGFAAKLHRSPSVDTLLILLLHHEGKTFVAFSHLSEPLLEGSPPNLAPTSPLSHLTVGIFSRLDQVSFHFVQHFGLIRFTKTTGRRFHQPQLRRRLCAN